MTDAAGEFVFNFLPVGLYTLKIEIQGFKTFENSGIELRAAQNIRQAYPLEVGNVTEAVKITSEGSLVNTVAPEQTQSFSSLQVKELPLARRNFNNILRIGTGITTAGEGGVRLNGLGRSGTRVSVDGTEASGNPEGPGTSMYQGFNYIDLLSIEAIQDFLNVKANRGPSTGDITHYFAADWVYDLPRFANFGNSVVRHILGGWQASGVFRAHTGQPFIVSLPSSRSASRPDLVDFNNAINPSYRSDLRYLNKAAFATIPKGAASGATLRAGSYGNNALRGPGLWSLDLSIAKNFAITERKKFQFRADIFNVLNHTNYTGLSTNFKAANFGMITGTAGARVIQLNARFSF